MTDRYKSIADMAISGLSRAEIAQKHETSKANIDRILSTSQCKDYRKSVENERNSRKKLNSSDRLLIMVNKLLESAERKLDASLGDDSKTLQLTDTVIQLTKLIPLPDNLNALDDIPIVYIPETQSIDGFNADTLNRSETKKESGKAQSETLSPGGSEIPAPSQKSNNNIEAQDPSELYSEIDEEFLIEGEEDED